LLFSAGSFEQANVDTASPMQLIEIVMKRATFPLVDAMSPFLSDSNRFRTRADRAARRLDRVEKLIPDLP
ncbi:MAG TPA: hypothetical protein VF003_00630, partial [Pseudonocardiaceae bacterium]